ncbi:MAG: endolytic transglycosylase MltG [Paludibacteraceae bacterium]|nr:endolytic transglycosylase MltG [Paludibacteraceae bacterium]
MKSKNNFKPFLTGIFILALLTGFIAIYVFIAPNSNSIEKKNKYLFIDDNSDFKSLTNQLYENKSIKSLLTFTLAARIYGYKTIKPGRYEITSGINNLRLVHKLKNGQQTPLKLTFNNLRTKEQLAGRLSRQIMADSASINQHLNDPTFLSKYGFSPETAVAMFIPDTYEVFWDMDATELFDRMKKEYDKFWNEDRKQKAAAIPLTIVEVSTLASIVEEETNKKAERPIVAGLYINRLRTSMPLQADPTVKFAYGNFGLRRITGAHLRIESPYNTYKNKGLPPGPIRLATASGIDAVLNFSKHSNIFMCAKETLNGEHNFAATYAEHQINARKYQKALDERKIFE